MPARDFVFVGMRAFQQSHGVTVERIQASSVTCGTSLCRNSGPFRIESAGEKIERHPSSCFRAKPPDRAAGQRMIIGDEVKRLAFVLKRDRRAHHAEIISDVQGAAGLDAGKNAHGVVRDFSTSLEMTSQWPNLYYVVSARSF